jgi:ribosomal protein S18 acetylase RimI-like enzyme
MKIRKGRVSDEKALYNLLRDTPELHAAEEDNLYTTAWVKNFLASKNLLVLVAEEKKQVVGFIMAELWEKQGYSFLSNIAIVPEFRRQGVGSKLYDAYEAYCKKLKLKCINYLVLATNEKMQNWSEKHGFKKGKMLYYYEKKL